MADIGIGPMLSAMLAPVTNGRCWDRTNGLCNVNATFYH